MMKFASKLENHNYYHKSEYMYIHIFNDAINCEEIYIFLFFLFICVYFTNITLYSRSIG